MPFLTLEDPNAKIKGSRDPLGVQPIWAAFGRHVVTNLTTQSSSVRGFTTLLLGRYFAAELVDRGMTSREDALDVFLRVTVQALWNVGTDFVLVPFAVISYALGDEAGAHEAIAA